MVKHFRELRVYQDAFGAAMRIFRLSRSWPQEERYALTDQIRRASRSASTNIAEAWRKRRYPAHFTSKLSDADSETAETQAWLDYAHSCGYLSQKHFSELDQVYEGVSAGLVTMMDTAESWCGPAKKHPHPHTPTPPYSRTSALPHSKGVKAHV